MSDEPFLVMRDVSVRFGKAEVVKNASLEVAAGEILGLIGESGSGKSMLAKAAFGLLPTSATASGSITVDG
ncbi:MAG: ATP-binding cassette domain-containing protein, partial [Verrucomicrobiota bacterium]